MSPVVLKICEIFFFCNASPILKVKVHIAKVCTVHDYPDCSVWHSTNAPTRSRETKAFVQLPKTDESVLSAAEFCALIADNWFKSASSSISLSTYISVYLLLCHLIFSLLCHDRMRHFSRFLRLSRGQFLSFDEISSAKELSKTCYPPYRWYEVPTPHPQRKWLKLKAIWRSCQRECAKSQTKVSLSIMTSLVLNFYVWYNNHNMG